MKALKIDWSSIFAAIAAIAAAFSAGISLLQQVKAKKMVADARRIDNETLWYNKIALDTIVTRLNEFIDRTERTIEDCKKNKNEILEQLNVVNKEINSDINSLNELLYLLKIFDWALFSSCSKKLEAIRDIYSKEINKSLEDGRIAFYSVQDIHAKKKEIVEELWQYAKIVTNE